MVFFFRGVLLVFRKIRAFVLSSSFFGRTVVVFD